MLPGKEPPKSDMSGRPWKSSHLSGLRVSSTAVRAFEYELDRIILEWESDRSCRRRSARQCERSSSGLKVIFTLAPVFEKNRSIIILEREGSQPAVLSAHIGINAVLL